ncbi:hypothetical protein M9H77_04737 [Catharanthus roseus]|uniref:Uncharacterized protein n=1 Tax=Catharanthus roseus TaxID=4058 RepID=A0ACC0CEX4_CATRO|nr:hypothetical protein M9H77_04737 [Catharanthus roseus]
MDCAVRHIGLKFDFYDLCSAQNIYNIVAKIKKNRMQRYNMPLLEAVGITPTGKNFTVATAFKQNEQAKTYRWVLQQIKHLYFSSTVSKRNEQDGSAYEPCVINIDRESSLMPVIEERHIDQNVLAKLTKMIKDEEIASRFVNNSWHKLLNEIDEQEYLKKLDVLKTKWNIRRDFLHYLFNTWLNPLAHKFVRVCTGQVLHFRIETANRVVESEHFILKLWLSTCHDNVDTVFLNIDSLIEGQIVD